LSRTAVAYTEKLLWIRGKLSIPQKDVDKVYAESIFVDSIKIRNISPFRKGCERENEVSSYIGKCKAVANSIMYLKGDMATKGRIAISRLRYRFQRFLPKTTNRTLSAIVSMPTPLGGLGLTTNVQRSGETLPEIFRKAYQVILDGQDPEYKVRRVLTGMWKPQSRRNVRIDDFSRGFQDQVLEQFGTKPLDWVRERLDPKGEMSNARLIAMAKKESIYTVDELDSLVEKPYIVRKLLQGQQDDKSLRVVPIKDRVSRAWSLLEAMPTVVNAQPILLARLDAASKACRELRFIDLSEETTAALDESGEAIDETSDEVDWSKVSFVEMTLKQMLLLGAPGLTLTL
jgi:hypothetical protein